MRRTPGALLPDKDGGYFLVASGMGGMWGWMVELGVRVSGFEINTRPSVLYLLCHSIFQEC